ncbi:MAG: hypothetical protein H6569_15780 [Lewinellaceae bacterium]|nr:hypothetical protein [Lewinellaceae bacterium]
MNIIQVKALQYVHHFVKNRLQFLRESAFRNGSIDCFEYIFQVQGCLQVYSDGIGHLLNNFVKLLLQCRGIKQIAGFQPLQQGVQRVPDFGFHFLQFGIVGNTVQGVFQQIL